MMSLPELLFWAFFWLFTLAEAWVATIRSVMFLGRASYQRVRRGIPRGPLIWLALLTIFILRCWHLAAAV
jgi:hypothetical protein